MAATWNTDYASSGSSGVLRGLLGHILAQPSTDEVGRALMQLFISVSEEFGTTDAFYLKTESVCGIHVCMQGLRVGVCKAEIKTV